MNNEPETIAATGSDTAAVATVALYTNPKGQPVTHSSYSARQTFKHCPREFELTRIQGYEDKAKRASTHFGNAIEAGLKFYEECDRRAGAGVEHFRRVWDEVKFLPDFEKLEYTDSEVNWDSLLRAGEEMMLLYELRAPFLPISVEPKVLFSQTMRKKLFPGTEYDKLENKAILDMVSFPRCDHPLLPKATHADGCEFQPRSAETQMIECTCGMFKESWRPLVIDVKTSGVDLDGSLVVLDPQLTEYAWQSRIPDVAFLWFVKHSHTVKKGSRVTLLEKCGEHKPGFELIVLWQEKESTDKKTGVVAAAATYMGNYELLQAYEKATEGLSGNALKDAKKIFARTQPVLTNARVTKQRLQFAAARMTEEDINNSGRDVAQTTAEMIRAHKEGYYPKLAGIRFPNQKCNFCAMRWICLNLPEERDKHLTRRGEEWLEVTAEGAGT